MLNIAPFRQTDDSRCGPACIKMILAYYGIEVTEDEICERCNWSFDLGCTDYQMHDAFKYYGLDCIMYEEASLDEIDFWLGKQVPVIVDWFSPGVDLKLHDMPNGHSSIVIALGENFIYLMDPEFGGVRTIRRDDFMRVWFDWRNTPYIQRCEDLILRQVMIALPKRLKHLKELI